MKFDNEVIKRTNMRTYAYGKSRIVYVDQVKKDSNGNPKLYYKMNGHLFGTFKDYCYQE